MDLRCASNLFPSPLNLWHRRQQHCHNERSKEPDSQLVSWGVVPNLHCLPNFAGQRAKCLQRMPHSQVMSHILSAEGFKEQVVNSKTTHQLIGSLIRKGKREACSFGRCSTTWTQQVVSPLLIHTALWNLLCGGVPIQNCGSTANCYSPLPYVLF